MLGNAALLTTNIQWWLSFTIPTMTLCAIGSIWKKLKGEKNHNLFNLKMHICNIYKMQSHFTPVHTRIFLKFLFHIEVIVKVSMTAPSPGLHWLYWRSSKDKYALITYKKCYKDVISITQWQFHCKTINYIVVVFLIFLACFKVILFLHNIL